MGDPFALGAAFPAAFARTPAPPAAAAATAGLATTSVELVAAASVELVAATSVELDAVTALATIDVITGSGAAVSVAAAQGDGTPGLALGVGASDVKIGGGTIGQSTICESGVSNFARFWSSSSYSLSARTAETRIASAMKARENFIASMVHLMALSGMNESKLGRHVGGHFILEKVI